jgi:hypothetical protein
MGGKIGQIGALFGSLSPNMIAHRQDEGWERFP